MNEIENNFFSVAEGKNKLAEYHPPFYQRLDDVLVKLLVTVMSATLKKQRRTEKHNRTLRAMFLKEYGTN